MKNWSQKETELLVNNKDKLDLKELSLLIGRSIQSISHKLNRLNLKKTVIRKSQRKPINRPNLVKEYLIQGKSTIEIAKKFNVTHRHILNELKRNNIKIKPKGYKTKYFKCWNKNRHNIYNESTLKRMHSPENTKKRLKASLKKPNKKEIILINLLKNLDLNYEFTGDGSFIVERFNPDFINIKKHKIIDLYGSYWHNLENVKKRDLIRAEVFLRMLDFLT